MYYLVSFHLNRLGNFRLVFVQFLGKNEFVVESQLLANFNVAPGKEYNARSIWIALGAIDAVHGETGTLATRVIDESRVITRIGAV